MAPRAQHAGLLTSRRVAYLKIAAIAPNPAQPRRWFDGEGLRELSDSIAQYGVLQPLTVRRVAAGYELVAGERRLRAAEMAGLTQVPCLVMGVSAEESSLLALVENLQRRDLDFIEEAEGIERLIRVYGLSQEDAARRLGKSPSAVSNKLRLLRHPPEVLALLRKYALTERHARVLLRLESAADRVRAIERIARLKMNVAQAERYVEGLLEARPAAAPAQRSRTHPLYVFKDVRLFLNTLRRAADTMRRAGVATDIDSRELEDALLLTIRIARKPS
ncbi:MAG: ParB/RepB/Spo0J family partition protein [Oscillospiraceae bacterium]|jgi:ParB family chromosome partitioning protein|nr:ParB/RepB/Spo0J family partition protein [Oscillospiraceae bacterium]